MQRTLRMRQFLQASGARVLGRFAREWLTDSCGVVESLESRKAASRRSELREAGVDMLAQRSAVSSVSRFVGIYQAGCQLS
jgi:hypothetical protein